MSDTFGNNSKSKWLVDDLNLENNDPSLDHQVIIALGWQVKELDPPVSWSVEPGTPGFPVDGYQSTLTHCIVDEDGENVSGNWHDEVGGWEHCATPPFSSDMHQAMRLVTDHTNASAFTLSFEHIDGEGWYKAVFLYHDADGRINHITKSAKFAARAICIAWLELQRIAKERP
jgi:hypothetical protein